MYAYLLFYFVHKAIQYIVCRVSLVEQKLLTLPEHLLSSMLFNGVRVARCLVFCVVLPK